MRGPKKIAVAVRKANGEIEVKVEDNVPLYKRHKLLSLPIIRGMAAFVDSLVVGVRMLSYSAEFFEEEESNLERFMKDKLKGRYKDFEMGLSLVISIVFAALLFFVLPTFAAGLIKSPGRVYTNILEGIIRLLVFLAYIGLISKLKDIQRVFQYHGAEHKSIYCYENGLELTVENARKFTRLHPRCGTNFLLIVMIISIFIFSFFGWPNFLIRILSRIILIPIVAGISYELIKWLGKSESKLSKILAYPGLMLQNLTTREPDDSQIEVAIEAIKRILPTEN
ncbi:DUF1385 domain-containing protein [Caloramator mitchellensis]|nr:DUF1385 domain-containing protein [Caloramator mitchellensis]